MTPQEICRAIAEPTGPVGAAFYFHADTLARGKELGLDGFRFYALGRGGVLGDVEADVVHSAFGYFNPSMVAKLWNSAKEIMAPRDAAREYLACAHSFGRAKLAEVTGRAELEGYVDAATTVVGAVDDSAMALFAGLRAEPVPGDVAAAAYHCAILLRELRGGAHLVAVASVGLPTVIAHAIKRPDAMGMFGWDEGAPVPTDADRAALAEAEDVTDRILVKAFAALSPTQASALVQGTQALHAAITAP
jgi:hypothetical protein